MSNDMEYFSQIRGQDKIKKLIIKSFKEDNISHAYIISGAKYSGKKLLADKIANYIGRTEEMKGANPDIIRLEQKKPGITGVDEIRELTDDAMMKPHHSGKKIYIIDNADEMTVSAQNALLKTLEEPPLYVVILLLTKNKEALLDTIISRSIILNIEPVPEKEIEAYMEENLDPPQSMKRFIVKSSEGNIGRAVFLCENPFIYKAHLELLDFFTVKKNPQSYELKALYGTYSSEGMDFSEFIHCIMRVFRDLLIYKTTGDETNLLLYEKKNEIIKYEKKYSYGQIREILDRLNLAVLQSSSKVNEDYIITDLLSFIA